MNKLLEASIFFLIGVIIFYVSSEATLNIIKIQQEQIQLEYLKKYNGKR